MQKQYTDMGSYQYGNRILFAGIVATLLVIFTIPSYADHDVTSFDGLTVVFVDLGTKGDSTLVIFPNGSTMLIDGGMPGAYDSVRDTMFEFGVSHINAIVATHPDQDHVAGLNLILDDPDFTVGQVYAGPTSKDTKTYQKFLSLADEKLLHAGDVIDLDPSVQVTVLSPPEHLVEDGKNASLENSNSVIILMEYGDMEFLFTGDTTYTTEAWLMNEYVDLDIDVMNAPHHGSKYGSTDGFIGATSPELVVYSANTDNKYGHPHPDTVSRYDSAGVWQVQTNAGNVLVQTDGERCSLVQGSVEHQCWADVMVVPEFPLTAVVMLAGMSAVIAVGMRARLC